MPKTATAAGLFATLVTGLALTATAGAAAADTGTIILTPIAATGNTATTAGSDATAGAANSSMISSELGPGIAGAAAVLRGLGSSTLADLLPPDPDYPPGHGFGGYPQLAGSVSPSATAAGSASPILGQLVCTVGASAIYSAPRCILFTGNA